MQFDAAVIPTTSMTCFSSIQGSFISHVISLNASLRNLHMKYCSQRNDIRQGVYIPLPVIGAAGCRRQVSQRWFFFANLGWVFEPSSLTVRSNRSCRSLFGSIREQVHLFKLSKGFNDLTRKVEENNYQKLKTRRTNPFHITKLVPFDVIFHTYTFSYSSSKYFYIYAIY